MRSMIRSLTLGLGVLLSAGAMAQYPYTIAVSGTVNNCYPGQVVTVQTTMGTQPYIYMTVPVDSATCTFSVYIPTSSNPAWVTASTLCGGAVTTVMDSSQFNSVQDTATSVLNFACNGGFITDCQGILNGPNMPGTPCESYPGSGVYGVYDGTCYCDTLSGAFDCFGIWQGPNMPGTSCSDNDPNTFNDTWDANCTCVGVAGGCQASFTVQQSAPWSITTTNTTVGQSPVTYTWWMPDGSSSAQFEPGYTFSTSGYFGMCLTISAGNGCTSTMCDTLVVDSAGMLYTGGGIWFDCMGVLFGPDVYGSPCDDGDSTTINDEWTSWCACAGTSTGPLDCLGIPGGSAQPGTICVDTLGGFLLTGIWDANCTCVINGIIDCLGVQGGTNLPGTACNDLDSLTINDTWDPNCTCVGMTSTGPCQAGFFVLQAYTVDSALGTATPIPNELWVWNLSSGGSGSYTFAWDFGDGSPISNTAFPTHVYANGGPYTLCLTIDDGMGCTNTFCDSVSVDANGMYTGMVGNDFERSGFTIRVISEAPSGIEDQPAMEFTSIWPNPVADELNMTLQGVGRGSVDVNVFDFQGNLVITERHALTSGTNQLHIATNGLAAGMYMVRIGSQGQSISKRFVKAH